MLDAVTRVLFLYHAALCSTRWRVGAITVVQMADTAAALVSHSPQSPAVMHTGVQSG